MSANTSELLPTAPATTYDIKRIRVFHRSDHDVVGVTENALPLLQSEAARTMLTELGYSVGQLDEPDVVGDQTVAHMVSIRPPFEAGPSEHLRQFAIQSVLGAFVGEWAPDVIDVRTQGVLVIDNRERLPESTVDTAGHVVASSFDYMQTAPARLRLIPDTDNGQLLPAAGVARAS